MTKIPLHCLVLCHNQKQITQFTAHECLSLASISQDLVGTRQIDLSMIAFAEMRHRIGLKLSLGERVVILFDGITPEYRQQLIDLADTQGAYIIDMCNIHDQIEIVTLSDTISQKNYRGITIIGDIHGNSKYLQYALDWAESRQNFAWLLGDIIDYGKNTLECINIVYRYVMNGRAGLILGNHERKIARWLDQKNIRISDGNRITTEAISALKPLDRKQWIGRFRSLIAHASLYYQIEHITLIHAAVHPSFWTRRPDTHMVEHFGLYGEGEINGKYQRIRRWVDSVPKGKMIFVGHDVISSFPMIITGAKGGQVVFLDTGSGKGGRLATADLRFTDSGLHLECFNSHI